MLINMLTKPQTITNTGPVSPIIQKAIAASDIVKPEPSPLEPTINPQTLVSELPIEQLDDVCNGASSVVDQSVSSVVLDEFCGFKDGDYSDPSGYLANNSFSSGHEVLDSSGGTSSSNGEFNDTGIMRNGSRRQVGPPPRIQKAGSVGRSIDVSRFKNYDGLCSEIERMFGLEGLLNDSMSSGWKLVYVDFENDVLLVGDDPWEEFVGSARCIRILSPCEVRRMGEEGMQLLNNSTAALQALIA
ncbi:putative transcription factor interactor and regulator AUX-IAA family [Helianthus debilis subsp. tardiflorus]